MARQQLDVFGPRAWHLRHREAWRASSSMCSGHALGTSRIASPPSSAYTTATMRRSTVTGTAMPCRSALSSRQRRRRLERPIGRARRRRAGRHRSGQQARLGERQGQRAHIRNLGVEPGLRPSTQLVTAHEQHDRPACFDVRRACQRVERVTEGGGFVERPHGRQQAVGARQVGDALVAACLGQRQVARLGGGSTVVKRRPLRRDGAGGQGSGRRFGLGPRRMAAACRARRCGCEARPPAPSAPAAAGRGRGRAPGSRAPESDRRSCSEYRQLRTRTCARLSRSRSAEVKDLGRHVNHGNSTT